ncbi:unnamed protein product, partial [Phaeothamnion confervicola]
IHLYIRYRGGTAGIIEQGVGFRNWKKRWFVLKGGELICYKD